MEVFNTKILGQPWNYLIIAGIFIFWLVVVDIVANYVTSSDAAQSG